MKKLKNWVLVSAVTLMSVLLLSQQAFGCHWLGGEIEVPDSLLN